MKYAFVFPGQGSQFVGMGRELAENFASAKEVFEEVNDALSQDLFKLMTEGPDADLLMTANTQPAMMANSMAIIRILQKDFGIDLKQKVSLVAGHSLGEYSACCAAGVFSLSDTAKLLRIRGDAMQQAVPFGMGAMAAIIGMSVKDIDALVEAASTKEYFCVAANDNSNGQIVISGHTQAIDRAIEIAGEFGAKKCVKLSVSAPFHSPLMEPAKIVMTKALHEVSIHNAEIPIVANVSAEQIIDKNQIIECLIKQVTGTVRWRETMAYFEEQKITDIVEIGAGKVLSTLAHRDLKNINSFSVNSPKDIENLIENL